MNEQPIDKRQRPGESSIVSFLVAAQTVMVFGNRTQFSSVDPEGRDELRGG